MLLMLHIFNLVFLSVICIHSTWTNSFLMNSQTSIHYPHTSILTNVAQYSNLCFSTVNFHSLHSQHLTLLRIILLSFYLFVVIVQATEISICFYGFRHDTQKLCSFTDQFHLQEQLFLILFFMLGIDLQGRRYWSFLESLFIVSFLEL